MSLSQRRIDIADTPERPTTGRGDFTGQSNTSLPYGTGPEADAAYLRDATRVAAGYADRHRDDPTAVLDVARALGVRPYLTQQVVTRDKHGTPRTARRHGAAT